MMAMMMTGRVLLVCALCVLWCGAGGVYARDLDNKALGGCMASGVLGMNASYVPNGCNKYMPTPPLRSALPIPAIQAEVQQLTDVSRDDIIKLSSDNAPGFGSGDGSRDKGAAALTGPAVPAASPTGVVPGAGDSAVPGPTGAGGSSGSEGDSLVPSSSGDLPSQSNGTVITSSDLSTTHSGSRE
ncbi:mucin-associated surface protein (MASP) [Trypanosoma cruzi]|nr:mucin-associated surface protein (MASP) [Trypanosoma cruzi]